MAGTNLASKYLEVIVAENFSTCQSPLSSNPSHETSETVVINGISWLKQTGGDATAGHINTWTAYSTSRDNVCVSLDFVLRAANPGVFTTPPPLFDEAAESAVFGQIVGTYAWFTVATPTSTGLPTETSTPTPTLMELPGPRGPFLPVVPPLIASLARTLPATWLRRLLGKPAVGPWSLHFRRNPSQFSIEHARRLLGYEPKIDFTEGMRRTEAWLRSAKYL